MAQRIPQTGAAVVADEENHDENEQNQEADVQHEPKNVQQQARNREDNASRKSSIVSVRKPPSQGSGRGSQVSHVSKKSLQNQLETEEELAAINEMERKVEMERLAEKKRLIMLKSQLRQKTIDEEEEEDDKRSNVLSNSSGSLDVSKWVEHQAKSVKKMHQNQQQPEERQTRRQLFDSPLRSASRHFSLTSIHTEDEPKTEVKADNFKMMAETIASAMKTVIQSAQPADGMKNFVARQTSGKDLPDFHGDPEEWPMFIARFRTSTELCGYSNEENVIRLQKCLKGRARESVLSMMSTGSNLKEIMGLLEQRFGRPEQVIKKMIDKARNVTPPTEGDFQGLLDFSIAVKNLCATAKSLDLPLYLNNPQLVEEFRKKLPYQLQLDWARHLVKTGKQKTFDLEELSLFLDEISSAAALVCETPTREGKKKHREQCMAVFELKCPLGCKQAHALDRCEKFKKMTVKERWDAAKKNGLCFVCLVKGHRIGHCHIEIPCDIDGCGKLHHPLLHSKDNRQAKIGAGKARQERAPVKEEEKPAAAEKQVFGMMAQPQMQVPVAKVLMKIAPVELTGPKGSIVVNAFLDGGSAPTMIEEEIAEFLGLDGACVPLHLLWQGRINDEDKNSKLVSLKIRGIDEEEEFELDDVRTKQGLHLPMQPLSSYKCLKKWTHLQDIPFPEVLAKRPAIVIGQEHSFLLLGRKVVEGPRNAPVASWTYLGWVAHGKNGKPPPQSTSVAMMMTERDESDKTLHRLVKEQFRLESLGIVNCKKIALSQENQRAEMLMETCARRVGDRWEAPMLWKSDDMKLPESYRSALSRLRMIEKKMDKDEDFAKLYEAKIQEYVDKGFCQKLTDEEKAKDCYREWYLAHFGTTNPNKPGKLRMVFDCAAKTNGSSLNDALLQGPDLMAPLLNVLLKFRQREIAFSGDIRDMFHRIKIRQEDVSTLRFMWRGKARRQFPPDVYQMDVMVFGAASSPFQAQWVKNQNALEYQEEFPEAVDAIINRHYVDDYLDSCTTPEEAIKKIMEVRDIHRRGGFEIRGWLCNNEDVLKVVAPGEQAEKQTKDVKEDKLERVLGLYWDPKKDVFKFTAKFNRVDPRIMSGEKVPTKRELLKLIMSLFDPLGFIAHLSSRKDSSTRRVA